MVKYYVIFIENNIPTDVEEFNNIEHAVKRYAGLRKNFEDEIAYEDEDISIDDFTEGFIDRVSFVYEDKYGNVKSITLFAKVL